MSGRDGRTEFLPLDAPGPRADLQTVSSGAATGIAKILVVDDDADLCWNLTDIFIDLGYDVDVAESGELGLEKARRQRYDVGLLDLKLPGMDGVTLCRRLKEMRPEMVTLIITAYASDGDVENARAAGASHVIDKPLDCLRLSSLINESLR